MNRHIEIIGCPIDLGAGRRGVDMGPSALRIAELATRLEKLGHVVRDRGDLEVVIPETQEIGQGRLRYKEAILATGGQLMEAVEGSLGEGYTPVVLGGDHSLAIGSVAGSSRHFAAREEAVGLIWFDAHGDA